MDTKVIANHQICNGCWPRLAGDRPFPLRRTLDGQTTAWDVCCYCGAWNNSGIYVRAQAQGVLFCTHNF